MTQGGRRDTGPSGAGDTLPQEVVQVIADLLPQIVRVTDTGGRAVYLNLQWQHYTGRAIGESLGLGWQAALHPVDHAVFHAAWQAGVVSGAAFLIEYRLRRADGSYRWFESHAVPLPAVPGQARLWLSSLTDIDARKHAAQERDAVLGSVAHDLRAPLTTVIGLAQVGQRRARRPTDNAEELVGTFSRIAARGKQMAAMVDELADLAELSRGVDLALQREPVELGPLVREAVQDAALAYPERMIQLEEPAAALTVEGDAARLTRVVANLIGNAVKYSVPPSPVRVSLVRDDGDGHAWAVLGVQDEGIGIPAGELPHVFDRFYRASNAVSRAPGTGIGLAGVKQVVEQHAGAIHIASTEGQGTIVTMRLPLATAEE